MTVGMIGLTGQRHGGRRGVGRRSRAAVSRLLRSGLQAAEMMALMDRCRSIAWELGRPAERSRAAAYRAIRSEIPAAHRSRRHASGAASRAWSRAATRVRCCAALARLLADAGSAGQQLGHCGDQAVAEQRYLAAQVGIGIVHGSVASWGPVR